MICLINVINTLNDKKEPVGHGLKTLKEFSEYFDEDVKILASKEYIKKLRGKREILPFSLYSGKNNSNSLKILCNYFISLIKAKSDILLYTIASEPLLWGIAFFKGNQKIVIITYEHWDIYMERKLANNPIRRFLLKRGLSRLDGCIITNTLYKIRKPYIRIPDFCISDRIKKINKKKKINACVCLGEMRYGKDIEGLIKVIRKTDIPLLVAGSFQDIELYYRVQRYKTNNITIKNKNLDYKNYIQYLSKYKYVILPYDAEFYDGRTSGVLLEGIFLNAIPIAPKNLLEQNKIQGLGYNNISEIPNLIYLYEKGEFTVKNNLEKYEVERHRKNVKKFMKYLSSI